MADPSDASTEATDPHALSRTLGPWSLMALGVGAIIGAGIFVVTGWAAARHAGPAVPLSFALAAVACGFTALCYSEMAAAVPVAGSAYTYASWTMGELMGWIIGWDLVLEYAMGAATVGVGWSAYFVSLLGDVGLKLPESITSAPFRWCLPADVGVEAGCPTTGLQATGHFLNVPAMVIVSLATLVLVLGIRESARMNAVIVALKLGVLVLFVAFGVRHVELARFHPFLPDNTGAFGAFGVSGIFRGAGLVFFTYIGFDAVSTAAQEAKRPQRDMPIGILGSLTICTILYMLVSVVLTGLVPYRDLDVSHPVGFAVRAVPDLRWMAPLIDLGAVLGLGSVILVMLLGQARVFYAMARDGLLPQRLAAVHPRTRTPYVVQILVGLFAAVVTGIFPMQLLGELVSIGTLLAFVLVSAGIIVLRRTRPDLARPFKTPWVPIVPVLGIVSCLALMATLPIDTWLRLVVWMVLGFAIYFGYGKRNARRLRDAGLAGRLPW